MHKQIGYNLIEIMLTLSLGVLVIAAMLNIYLATLRSSADTVKAVRLNYDMDAIMALMVNDIRRAGYWGDAMVTADSKNNVFINGLAANLQLPNGACLLYSYDADADGQIDANEFYGFKLEEGAIRMRFSGTTTADCNNGAWQEASVSQKVVITHLSFQAAYQCINTNAAISYEQDCATLTPVQLPSASVAVESRMIKINVMGHLVGDIHVAKALNSIVKIKNDRIFMQP
ncbi:MAG: hypothetical protein WC782_15260 [Methylococcaceae bacterium]|jgi:type IV pilus assembly protein PilW